MFDKKKYDIQFQKENYDRISLNVKKGDREKIAEHAKRNGFDSSTDYIKHLIYTDMNNIQKTKSNINIENITQNANTINMG